MEIEPKDIDRFVIKVIKTGNCWEWTADKHKGYGRFNLNGKVEYAHRVSYEIFRGDIPIGLTLDHLCRNPACVNPEHLEAVTVRENTLRGKGFSAINARKNKCPYGHEYTFKNNRGDRVCRICKRSIAAKHRAKAKILGIDRNRYKKVRKGLLL